MKDEYDFSNAERGKFHREDATLNLPVYLTDENRAYVEQIAKERDVDVTTVVNDLVQSKRHTTGASD